MTETAARTGALDVPILPAGLSTPCLVVDLDIVERNIARLAVGARERGARGWTG